MAKILIIHGPNLGLLGKRQIEIYGDMSLGQINNRLGDLAKERRVGLEIFQSDHEGEIVEKIGKSKDEVDAIVINPAAFTHTSVAIRDAIEACQVPTVEVHLSNIYAREEFRHTSLIAPVAKGQISGFGLDSYLLGLEAAVSLVKK